MIEVVTVWAPRPAHPKYRDYLELLALHRASVERLKHRHWVVTDTDLPGYRTMKVDLPESLMHAILTGQLAFMRQWDGKSCVVLADIDCLVCHDLHAAFSRDWAIGLTSRPDPVAPIQNGAMFFAPGSQAAAVALLEKALELCSEHWGGDQEAIAKAVAPVPDRYCSLDRFGVRFAFLSCEHYNHSSKGMPDKNPPKRLIEHFKGESKQWAAGFARDYLGIR